MEDKNTYELGLIISPDLSEFDVQKLVDKIKASITAKEGEIQKEHNWSKKRLSYHIKQAEFGYYHTLIFSVPKEAINELNKEFLLMPEILRYLIISLEKERVGIDQLLTPEKEAALIATLAKEKMEPTKPHQTRATRGRVTPAVETAPIPEILKPVLRQGHGGLTQVPTVAKAMMGRQDDATADAIETPAESEAPAKVIEELTKDEEIKRREELDKKLDELLKE